MQRRKERQPDKEGGGRTPRCSAWGGSRKGGNLSLTSVSKMDINLSGKNSRHTGAQGGKRRLRAKRGAARRKAEIVAKEILRK